MMKRVGKPAAANTTRVPKAPPLDLSTVAPPFSPPGAQPSDSPRHFGLRSAPVFYPTEEEFMDPLRYIESIRVEGELSGICKIVPPRGWNPDFAMDTQTFWFRPRIMRLNSMEGSSRAILNYLDQLQKFHNQQGTQFTRIPMLDKKPINLFELKKEVAKRGGYTTVTRGKMWAQVGRAIGLGGKTCTSLSHSVKTAYGRWIHPYEEFMAKHGSPAVTRQTSGDEGDGVMGPSTRAARKDLRTLRKQPLAVTPPIDNSETPLKHILPTNYAPKPGLELCEICGGGEADQMLLCDGCNRGYHLYCFDPPMQAIPNTDWFCPDCLRGSGHDYGFEEGEVRSLYHFQQVANNFKEDHFRQRNAVQASDPVVVTEAEVEKEFWRLVESPYDDVEVEYGADLHSTQHGSGFPNPEMQPTNPYATCGWNLNNMPVLPESLFCNIRNDISGMMIPWLYVGMVFSTFCWHTEDHYTYSINYLHWGETKTWYGIPASNAEKFEATMKKTVPELFEGNPDLLFHLTTMLSPAVLINNDVEVVGVDQRPGEFVITFPKAYHAGFNQGFNFAEAVNFALPDWLPTGLDCVDRYHFYRKQPVFSHDELIIATSKRDIDVRSALWLKPALEHLRDRELTARKDMRNRYPGIQESVENLEINREEEDQCTVCHQYCYVSGIRCLECNNGKVACFEHEDEVCKCEKPQLSLKLRFDDAQLNAFVEHAAKVASRPSEWKIKHDELLSQHRRPPLKELQRLLAASEKIPYVIEEAVLLKDFVSKAGDWIERAGRILQKRKRATGRRSMSGTSEEVEEASSERTLENVESLLSEAEKMSFDAPEIKLVEALAASVYEFRAEARAVLDIPDVTEQQVKDAIGWSEALGFHQLEEVDMLERKLAEIDWIRRAQIMCSNMSASRYTHEEVLETIDEGRALLIKSDHPLIQSLKGSRLEGDEWRILAAGLLKQRTMDFEDLKDAAAKGALVPAQPELWDRIFGLVEKCTDWLSRVKVILNAFEEKGERNPTHILFSLVEDMENVPVRFEELQVLRDDAKKVTEWVTRSRRVLRSGSAKPCAEIIRELEINTGACTKKLEEQGDVFCVCRTRADEGLMIECETCHIWYHSHCVKLSKKAAKTQSEYMCPACDVWSPRTLYKRPTVAQISQLIEDAVALPRWNMEESDGLRRLLEMLTVWKDRVRLVLSDTTSNATLIKDYLRCGEGMSLDVEDEITELRQRVGALCSPPAPPPPPTQPPAETPSVPNANVELFCVCRRPHREEDGEMIGCDRCTEWYHFACIGLTAAETENIDTWACPQCLEADAAAKAKARLTKEVMRPRSEEGDALKRITLKINPPQALAAGAVEKKKSIGDAHTAHIALKKEINSALGLKRKEMGGSDEGTPKLKKKRDSLIPDQNQGKRDLQRSVTEKEKRKKDSGTVEKKRKVSELGHDGLPKPKRKYRTKAIIAAEEAAAAAAAAAAGQSSYNSLRAITDAYPSISSSQPNAYTSYLPSAYPQTVEEQQALLRQFQQTALGYQQPLQPYQDQISHYQQPSPEYYSPGQQPHHQDEEYDYEYDGEEESVSALPPAPNAPTITSSAASSPANASQPPHQGEVASHRATPTSQDQNGPWWTAFLPPGSEQHQMDTGGYEDDGGALPAPPPSSEEVVQLEVDGYY